MTLFHDELARLLVDAAGRTTASLRHVTSLAESVSLLESATSYGPFRAALTIPFGVRMNTSVSCVTGTLEDVLVLYRGASALCAARYAELRALDGTLNDVDGTYVRPTLGRMHSLGNFPVHSVLWFDARSTGLTGTEVSVVVEGDADRVGRLVEAKRSVRQAARLRVENVSDRPTLPPRPVDPYTPMGRGTLWEPAIRFMVADRNPDERYLSTKDTWGAAADGQLPVPAVADLDGLRVTATGVPQSILEIKTSSGNAWWGEGDGFGSLPLVYQAQVLWYAHNAGVSTVVVGHLNDDIDYTEHRFDVDEPEAQNLWDRLVHKAGLVWKRVEKDDPAVA